ncbi:MAG: ATP-binding protein [Dehalobacterium sp.]
MSSEVLENEHLFKLINKQLSRIFGTVDGAILIIDNMGVINYVNPGFEKLTGYQVGQLIGENITKFPAPWTDFLKNQPVHNLEGVMDVIWDKEGRTKYVNWKLSSIQEDGEMFGWLIIINDKTDYYYWQQAVGQAERLSATSLLLGSLAHEIRNPLSAIKGLLQLMGRKRDPDSMRSYIDLSLRELDRITMLLNEFLLLGKPVAKNEPICLAAFLQELMPMMQNDGNLYDIEVILDIKSKPQVQGDWRQLIKAVENLVQNAFEATKSNGRIVVSLFDIGENAYIAVRDYGPGVSKEIQDKIFRPFFSTKYRAKGLGLPVSQAVIHNHGGDISFVNEPEGGAVFNVILPIYDVKNMNKPVDIVVCIKDRLICYPVMQSLQTAGFKVLLAEEDQVLALINKHKPLVCLLEGIREKRDLVEQVKKENESVIVIILGFVEPEMEDLVINLNLPVNYDQLLSKIALNIKG